MTDQERRDSFQAELDRLLEVVHRYQNARSFHLGRALARVSELRREIWSLEAELANNGKSFVGPGTQGSSAAAGGHFGHCRPAIGANFSGN